MYLTMNNKENNLFQITCQLGPNMGTIGLNTGISPKKYLEIFYMGINFQIVRKIFIQILKECFKPP